MGSIGDGRRSGQAERRRPAIADAIIPLIEHHGLLIVAVMVAVAELGLPTGVSPKIALLVAGSIVIGSPAALLLALAVVTGANLLGAALLHLLARGGGGWLVDRVLGSRGVRPERVMERWRTRCGGHDAAAIFVGRITPIVRIYVTLASGLLRVRWRDFLLGAGLAAVVWSGIPLVLGYIFRDNVARLVASPLMVELVVLAVPLVGVVATAGWWIARAGSITGGLRRGRVVTGGVAAVVVAAWAVKTVRASAWAHGHQLSAPDLPVLLLWLSILAGLIACAVARAVADLRGREPGSHGLPWPRFAAGDVAGTLLWAGGLGVAGAIITSLELMYPAL